MANNLIVPMKTPRLYNAERHARNGIKPNHVAPLKLGKLYNFGLVRCRKVLFQKAIYVNSSVYGSDTQVWFFKFYTGIANAGSLRMRVVAAVEQDCKFDLVITPSGGSPVTTSFDSPSSSILDIRTLTAEVDLTEDKQYEGYVEVKSGYRAPLSLTCYEVHDAALDPADATTCDVRRFYNRAPIYDDPHEVMVEKGHELYKKNGKAMLFLCPDRPTDFWTRTSSTAVNMLDGSSTTVTSSTPGFNFLTDPGGRLSGIGPSAIVWVYGRRAAGLGANQLQLHDSGGVFVNVTLGSSLDWYSTVFEFTPGEKVDVFYKGDSVNATTIYTVIIHAWDT